MGGYGSGSYQAATAKQTVEDVVTYRPALTMPSFKRAGFQWDKDGSGVLRWASGSLAFSIYDNLLTLVYALPSGSRHTLRVRIVATTPNYGGRRMWFQCPTCGRRCAHIYRPANQLAYSCRVCAKLQYASTRDYPNMRDTRAMIKRFDQRQKRIAKKFGLTWPIK